ncbi:MAG TPA: CBS domain-containing protein [Patescibacteria group bacterium]|nr:CBS domain-containing protein [Patescibacteria group bacterium]
MIVRALLKTKASMDVATAMADDGITATAQLLHHKRIGALVVIDDQRNIVGIISERDIARGLALYGKELHSLKVRDLMTSAVLVCTPDDTLEKLMEIMTNNRVRHLPVMEDGKLSGMISIGDVVKERLSEATMQIDSLRNYVMAAR